MLKQRLLVPCQYPCGNYLYTGYSAVSWSLLKLISTESVMPSNHFILCCLLPLGPSIFPNIRVFSSDSALLFISGGQSIGALVSASVPENEYSGLISFRIDWFDPLVVQRSLLQQHSSKESVPQHPAFFMVQLSHPYMTIGKTIALTRWTFVGKVMSLLFNDCLDLPRLFFQGASAF